MGNLGRIDAVSGWVAPVLRGREILVSALFSQALSNVPAAILLSGIRSIPFSRLSHYR